MNKLASFNYDLNDYIMSGELSKVASLIRGLSKEAQSIDVPNFDEVQDRPESDFALITYHPKQGGIKKYAKWNKELTELSIAFLENNITDLPDEIVKVASTNLCTAANEYGLEAPKLLKEASTSEAYIDPTVDLTQVDDYAFMQKIATKETPTEYALPEESKYPIETPRQIDEAQHYFDKFAHDFYPPQAVTYAKRVKEACLKNNIEVKSSLLQKFASLDTSSQNEDFSLFIESRKSYLNKDQKEDRGLYDDLVKTAETLSPSKLALLTEKVDKTTGLDRFWGNGVENPALASFAKEAEMKGTGPSLEQLKGLSNADLTAVVGNEAIKDLKGPEGVQVYHTLPSPIKKEIDTLLL